MIAFSLSINAISPRLWHQPHALAQQLECLQQVHGLASRLCKQEIAQYLQRDVATVRRWEKTSGLPVRRVPGSSSRAVFAYASELEA